jgi:hypothetical protein
MVCLVVYHEAGTFLIDSGRYKCQTNVIVLHDLMERSSWRFSYCEGFNSLIECCTPTATYRRLPSDSDADTRFLGRQGSNCNMLESAHAVYRTAAIA